MDRLENVLRDVDAGASAWWRRAEVEWQLIYTPYRRSNPELGDLQSQMRATAGGFAYGKGLTAVMGARLGTIATAPTSIVSLADQLAGIAEQLALAGDLYAFSATLDEASAWREAAAYTALLLERYDLARRELETALSLMRQAETYACTCLQTAAL